MANRVAFVTELPFGTGVIGERYPLHFEDERQEFAAALQEHTLPLAKTNTADCVDERRTLELGDGTTDPGVLERRIVPQLAGGLGLAVTKAAVGADLAVIRDSKDFKTAYLTMVDLLRQLEYEDGGHGNCGASNKVEKSVADEVEAVSLLGALPLLTSVEATTPFFLQKNQETKLQRLEAGYYGKWSNTWHEGFLADTVPQNLSILAVDHGDPVTYGHNGSGIYPIQQAGVGFAKNRFIRNTGQEAFATTVATADVLTNQIIEKIGGSAEERARLRLEFAVDPAQVLNQLVVEGIAVFTDIARK